MPHASLKLIPGVDRNRTEALNEAAIWDCNLIRFMPDRQGGALPQKLGGWVQFTAPGAINAPIRSLNVWSDTNDNKYLGVGTENALYYAQAGTAPIEISPQYYEANIPVSLDTTSGSSVVTINDTGSNNTPYNSIYIETPISVGGVVLSGFYSCQNDTYLANSYTVNSANIIGIPVPATSTVTGGGAVPVFTPTSGRLSIIVTLADHTYTVGSTFAVLVDTTVGAVVLSGNYIVSSVLSSSQFTISAPSDPASSTPVTMNGGKARIIYYIGQNIVPPIGYGLGGYGLGGYGIGVASANGRQYTGVSITTSGGVCTATLTGIMVYVAPGSNVVIDPGTGNQNYTVLSAVSGTNSTFKFAGSLSGSYTVTVSKWGLVMPSASSQDSTKDWSLDNWGEYMIANPHGGEVFFWNPSEQNHATVVPNAPLVNEGCFVAMPERQIVAYGSTFTGVQDPLLVRWCDIADFTSWVGTVVNQAGSFRIPKGSKIIGGIQGPQQGFLWTDVGLWSMQYVNQPLIYSFNEVASGCGLVGRKAMGTLSGITYWMSQSQFFSLSGSGVQPVNCPIWDIVFQNIDPAFWENVRCAPNSRFNEIAWFFPMLNADGSSGDGTPKMYVKYNAAINQWDFGTLTRTAWIDQSVFGPPIGAGADLDIYQHEVGYNDDGNEMDAYIQTGYFSLQEGDLQTFIDQVWPDMKWGAGSSETASIKITFFAANYPGDTPRSYVFDNITKATQFLTPRIRARLLSIRVEGKALNAFWRLGNIRYRLQQDGKF